MLPVDPASPRRGNVGMPLTSPDTPIRSRVAAFADELAKLVKVATLQAVLAALEKGATSTAAPRPMLAWAQPRDAAVRAPNAAAAEDIESGCVTSIDDYERAAVQRAVAESRGNVNAAAKALGITNTATYRRMTRLGVTRRPKGGPGALDDGLRYLMTDEMVSVIARGIRSTRSSAKLVHLGAVLMPSSVRASWSTRPPTRYNHGTPACGSPRRQAITARG
ncbi:MAG: helix-turn-helix domain-containing protein [Gemmatimonadaceae bacterium]|nr:helix-turn-helix domain-containing protein [Gemmatimonadaceae bacterium]